MSCSVVVSQFAAVITLNIVLTVGRLETMITIFLMLKCILILKESRFNESSSLLNTADKRWV